MGSRYCCMECGNEFDEARVERQTYGEGCGYDLWEYVELCPECGSADIEESEKCVVCGEWHIKGDGAICSDCRGDIKLLWDELKEKLPKDADASEVAGFIAEELV